jgi:hypothetical protein
MKGFLIALGLLAAAGCASSERQARYESPHPPQVIVPAPAAGAVIATPPAGSTTLPPRGTAAVPALTENEAAELARAEAYRRGWRSITVKQAVFTENRWHMDLRGANDRAGWIDVAPDGTVLKFAATPDEHDEKARR